ncbi:winged helix-turn-helix domain-containing protein [Pseudoalteromonas luteoviolacea]|uniref:winged helix-turn-helix domain-containing protein n=1 Tax=Pseudoalteromonas luteoviolacea TaxID=43657 RepID=UPI00114E1F40|nr:winged helix-turn-helix domain-containing protein [Pseudoalteromonas luteoviolacea]TQF70335.1 hypothetical protein FLM44_04365 [Pseudoalteromonas luteoviolacea]
MSCNSIFMTSPSCFYINDFLIDLTRSEVIYDKTSTKVEPKVLQVLYLLAQHPNQVVSHQQIMDQVWHGTEVVPNALQRCIARLRKVLGDDAKSPHIIATHPKIGYRLMVEVRWQQNSDKQTKLAVAIPSSINKRIWIAIISFTLFFGIMFSVNISNELKIKSIKQLTHTDAFESNATYSPDGKYVVFNRHENSCQSHIWAKHMETGIESRLTEQAGFYRNTRFTPDGRSLIYTQQRHCNQASTSQHEPHTANCWQINMLDLAASLHNPQPAIVRLQCQNEQIERPIALPNHQYAYLNITQSQTGLFRYSATAQAATELFKPSDMTIYTYDYDHNQSQFIVLGYNDQFQHRITIIDNQGSIVQQNTIHFNGNSVFTERFNIHASMSNNSLIAVNQGQLYHLNLNGQLSKYESTTKDILSAYQHPTKPQLLAVKGYKDIDIAELSIVKSTQIVNKPGINQRVTPYISIARTKALEISPKYQPAGELIAFISTRSGHSEIWLWDGEQSQQLSHFESQAKFERFVWSPNGQHIAVVVDGSLKIIDLKGNVESFVHDVSMHQAVAWPIETSLFFTSRTTESAKSLWQFDFNTYAFSQYPVENAKNIWPTSKFLFYSDFSGKVFKRDLSPKTQKAQHLPSLNGNSLVMQQSLFYGYDSSTGYLSAYSLSGEFKKQLIPLKPFAWKLTDIRDNTVLIEQVIEVNQDVVELTF